MSSGSRFAAAIHSFISGIAMMLLAVGGACGVELDVVGAEARHHRRVHRIGHAALAEQERARRSSPRHSRQMVRDALDVGERPAHTL